MVLDAFVLDLPVDNLESVDADPVSSNVAIWSPDTGPVVWVAAAGYI